MTQPFIRVTTGEFQGESVDTVSVQNPDSKMTVDEIADSLVRRIAGLDGAIVAFSAGVDSTVVATAARKGLGREKFLAVTAVSPSLPTGEQELAAQIAIELDFRHVFVQSGEQNDSRYIRNSGDRCYWCKSNLYQTIRQTIDEPWPILNGTNIDDLGDYRPGLKAASEFNVISPLAELSITKLDVRDIARRWGLSVAEKPAGPCLASRLANGVEVTPQRLASIDGAEALFRNAGFETVRVRLHAGEIARIEVPINQVIVVCQWLVSNSIADRIKALGFRFVTLDCSGFQSGNLNQLIPSDQLFSIGQKSNS